MGTDVVTGGAGFIGSHLVDRLLAAGRHVRVVDDLSVGRRENLAGHRGNPALELIEASVTEAAAVARAVEGAERVFHLAARADIVPSVQQPEVYFRSNVEGTFVVLEAARRCHVKRFVYMASSSCYGIPDQFPTPETAAFRPQYPYALTKALGESTALHWQQVYGLPVVSLRGFNVYGPRARTSGAYGAVFGVFLAQLLAGEPLTVVGDGTQTRDFTFVWDVVDAIVLAAESERQGVAYNIGGSPPVSINRLVELLGATRVVHVPKRPGEPDCTWADASAAARDLGWRPKVPIEAGVRVMLEHIEAWRDAPVWTPQSIATATADWFRFLGRPTGEKT